MKNFAVVLLLSAIALPAEVSDWKQRMEEANWLDRLGQYEKAESLFTAAVAEAERFGPGDHRLPEALNNYGAHLFATAKYQDAEVYYRRALSLWSDGTSGKAQANRAAVLNNLGALYRATGSY